jgi:Ca2+-binding RTX toxin-like protein
MLSGGKGRDSLTGGLGNDQFIFKSMSDLNVLISRSDIIVDFHAGDKIVLDFDANTVRGGIQNFHLVQALGGHVGELIAERSAGAVVFVQGDVNGDGVADFAITVRGIESLANTNFVF